MTKIQAVVSMCPVRVGGIPPLGSFFCVDEQTHIDEETACRHIDDGHTVKWWCPVHGLEEVMALR